MSKSRDAFRTISEVSDLLDTPAHVLRFWESKFSQVKPVKRAGGRRYYRPADADLLAGIKQLLHDDGMTIKGAQKLLREKGIKHVAAIGAANLSSQDAPEDVTPQQDAPAVIETKSLDTTSLETATDTAPVVEAEEPEGEAEVDISNVALPDNKPADGPALTLHLGSKPEQKPDPTPPADPEVETTASDPAAEPEPAAIFIPDDPADSDSKAPARLFHLMQHASHEKLAQQAEAIAPLLDRMQILRDRIAAR